MPVMMEIMFVLEDGDWKHKEERPYHITYYELHMMFACILFCLYGTLVELEDDPSFKFQVIKCSPLVSTVAKACCFEAPRDDRVC